MEARFGASASLFLLRGHRGYQSLQEFVRGAEAALELLGEITLRVRRIVELVLVFDVHRARVSRLGENREEAFPVHRAVARDAEPPPPRIVHRLDAAALLADMDLPGFRLHPLKGELRDFCAVTVRANWRVIFRFEHGEASDVDYIDYH